METGVAYETKATLEIWITQYLTMLCLISDIYMYNIWHNIWNLQTISCN